MSIEQSRIEQLEAELVIARGQLKLASDAGDAERKHIAELERRISKLLRLYDGERAANSALRAGVEAVLERLRAIEAAYVTDDAALFGA